MRIFATLLVLLVACGDDPPQANPTAPTAAAPAAVPAAGAPGAGSGSGKPLPTMSHVEDRVKCQPPRSDGKKCDPNATKPITIGAGSNSKPPEDLTCPENQACLETKDAGWLCGMCPERFAIRHEFKERDFADETNRDPFQSFVVKVPGTTAGSNELPKEPGSKCVRPEQLRVVNYGYQDLKLVGIVSQGTQRKVLMMDPGNYGHIIRRGDCVGKEKAWVKDIGDNFICFEMSTDASSNSRLSEGQCVELHNKALTVSQLPQDDSNNTISPPVLPAQQNPTPAPRGPTTTIIPGRQQQNPNPVPAPQTSPPVNLKP